MTAPVATLHRHTPEAFFARCAPFFATTQAEHNLILGLAPGLISGRHDYEPPIYLASIEVGGRVVGYAFRTPPFKLGVSALPADAVAPLVDDVAATYDAIPAVMGPSETAAQVAEAWAAKRGCDVRAGQRMRIHALGELADLTYAPGHLRVAERSDHAIIRDWLTAFEVEAGVAGLDPDTAATRMIAEG